MAMIYSVYRGEHFLDVGTYKELSARWAVKIYQVCNEQDL